MNRWTNTWRTMTALILPLGLSGLLLAPPAGGQIARDASDSLAVRAFDSDALRTANDATPLADGLSFAATGVDAAWQRFAGAQSVAWSSDIDRRTGRIDYAEGGNVAWIPGAGNALSAADIGLAAGGELARLESLARRQAGELADALGVDAGDLVLNPGRSGNRGGTGR